MEQMVNYIPKKIVNETFEIFKAKYLQTKSRRMKKNGTQNERKNLKNPCTAISSRVQNYT